MNLDVCLTFKKDGKIELSEFRAGQQIHLQELKYRMIVLLYCLVQQRCLLDQIYQLYLIICFVAFAFINLIQNFKINYKLFNKIKIRPLTCDDRIFTVHKYTFKYKIKQKIKLKYCSHNSDSTICEDVIAKLDDIKYDDLKSHQAILAGGGKNHSLNRFKFSDEFWNKFKKRDEKNIFDDFEFII